MRNVDGTASRLAFFGAELRRIRMAAGLSQEQLGQRIGYSGPLIGKAEIGERAPSEDLAGRCDEALDAQGLLPRIYELARRWDRGHPSWFALRVIIDETVLRRHIGGSRITYDQLTLLAAQAKRPNITMQVLPGEVGAHVGLMGGLAIASGNGDRQGPALVFTPDEWRAFLDGVRAAEFDLG